ncbi:MAG TPA: DUF4349 domain-containing protein [Nannocystaceae bacterium]|nr:DUF4349 domain-containing protein [Nannocystaceae bacterium]
MLLLLGLVSSGCMKAKMSDAAYPGEAAGAAAPTMAPMDEMEMERGPMREAKRSAVDFDGEEADAPALAKSTTAMPEPTTRPPGDTTKGEPAVEDPRKDIGGRLIIYTAGMRISVFNLEEAMDKAEALPEKYGGYVFSMSAGALVLKIPARKLRAAMVELGGYGVVEEKSLVSQDVSAEYTDIESRIKALEGTHKQLLELLSKARTVDEALHVRQALDQTAAELEVLKGRMRQLDSLISFSTLTVALYERGPFTPTPTSNDPFPWVDQLGVESTEWK